MCGLPADDFKKNLAALPKQSGLEFDLFTTESAKLSLLAAMSATVVAPEKALHRDTPLFCNPATGNPSILAGVSPFQKCDLAIITGLYLYSNECIGNDGNEFVRGYQP